MGKQGSALVTVRHGHTVTAIHDACLAERHLQALSSDRMSNGGPTFRGTVDEAATSILGVLVKRFPQLCGKAAASLPTALRVKEVRGFLAQCPDLALHLVHISDAASAFRHLTPELVQQKVDALKELAQH